jgi:hypothetical protein
MTTASSITANLNGISSPSVSAAPAAASESSITSKPLTKATTAGISPRIVADPTAGIIIQYLSGSGQVQSQIPSATVVAYLRAGLTSQGFAKPQNTEA